MRAARFCKCGHAESAHMVNNPEGVRVRDCIASGVLSYFTREPLCLTNGGVCQQFSVDPHRMEAHDPDRPVIGARPVA